MFLICYSEQLKRRDAIKNAIALACPRLESQTTRFDEILLRDYSAEGRARVNPIPKCESNCVSRFSVRDDALTRGALLSPSFPSLCAPLPEGNRKRDRSIRKDLLAAWSVLIKIAPRRVEVSRGDFRVVISSPANLGSVDAKLNELSSRDRNGSMKRKRERERGLLLLPRVTISW